MTKPRLTGHVTVSVTAGHLRATSQPVHPEIGQQVEMGENLYFHITPAIARQWIDVLKSITGEK